MNLKTFDTLAYTNRTIEDYISKAKWELRDKFPFFGYLVSRLKWKKDLNIPTAGVDGSRNLYYNPDFLDKLSTDINEKTSKIVVIAIHEVMHLALNHPYRQGSRNSYVEYEGGQVTVWNLACDIVVNNIIVQNNFALPEGTIRPRNDFVTIFEVTISDISKKSAEEIYSELVGQMKKEEKENQSQSGSEKLDQKQGQSKNGNGIKTNKKAPVPIDSHDKWNENKQEKDSHGQDMKDSWKKAVYTAYEFAKQQGKSPLGVNREIEGIGRSKVNWRQFIRREVSKAIPYNYNWNKPHKKYLWQDIFMPSYYGEKTNVLVYIDSSGSISKRELGMFLTELIAINKTFREVEFRILVADAEVQDDLLLTGRTEKKLKAMTCHGGGGTDTRPVYDYIKEHKYDRKHKLLISFTDGYTSWPEKPVKNFETICILAGGHCPKEQVPNWIKTICIE